LKNEAIDKIPKKALEIFLSESNTYKKIMEFYENYYFFFETDML